MTDRSRGAVGAFEDAVGDDCARRSQPNPRGASKLQKSAKRVPVVSAGMPQIAPAIRSQTNCIITY